MKLANVIKEEIARLTDEVREEPTKENGRALGEAVLCYLILFNKRRGGEMAKMLHETFVEACKTQDQIVNEEILKSLSELEKQLSKRLTLVNIKGKRGRHVPGNYSLWLFISYSSLGNH